MKCNAFIIDMLKKYLLVFFTVAITCLVLLTLVYTIDETAVFPNAAKSAVLLEKEGLAPVRHKITIDTFTDAIMIGEACYDGEEGPFRAALSSAYGRTKEEPIASLAAYTSGQETVRKEYARYWHGYLIILKPLLLFMSYKEIRIFNYVVTVLLLLGISFGMWKRKVAVKYILSFLITLIAFGITVIPNCMQFMNMFLLLFAALLVLLWKHTALTKNHNDMLFFFAFGMLTAFFDFLTTPVIILGIPLLFLLLLEEKEEWKTKVRRIVRNSCSFGMGYSIFWATKWILATAVLQKDILATAMASADKRSSMVINDTRINYIQVVVSNIECLRNRYVMLLLAAVLLILLFAVFRYHKSRKEVVLQGFPYLLVACIPFVWFLVLSNHSFEHNWFTYRDLSISLLGGLFFLCNAFEWKRKG